MASDGYRGWGWGQVFPGPWPGPFFVLFDSKRAFLAPQRSIYAKKCEICPFFLEGPLVPKPLPPPHGVNPGFATEDSTKVQQIHNECNLVQTEWPDLATQSTKNVVGKRHRMCDILYGVSCYGTYNRKVQHEYFLVQTWKNLVRE